MMGVVVKKSGGVKRGVVSSRQRKVMDIAGFTSDRKR
jgi:hypothetical protein